MTRRALRCSTAAGGCTLAGLYTLRVLAGGQAANVEVSKWLLAFCIFFFLSLAFAKRYSELLRIQDE